MPLGQPPRLRRYQPGYKSCVPRLLRRPAIGRREDSSPTAACEPHPVLVELRPLRVVEPCCCSLVQRSVWILTFTAFYLARIRLAVSGRGSWIVYLNSLSSFP